MYENQVIYVELTVSGISAEILINDIPLDKVDIVNPPFLAIPIMQYLINGENSVEVIINPGEIPSKFRTGSTQFPKVGANFKVRIAIYSAGDFLGEGLGTTLAKFEWARTEENEDQDKERFPLRKIKNFIASSNNNWSWLSAPNLQLNEQTIDALNSFVQTIHKAFESCNPDPILERSQIRNDEFEQSYPAVSKSSGAVEFQKDLLKYKDKPWKIEPFNPENTDYRLIANGKMIECIGKDWQPIVRTVRTCDSIHDEEIYFPYAMKVAYIDGELKIIR